MLRPYKLKTWVCRVHGSRWCMVNYECNNWSRRHRHLTAKWKRNQTRNWKKYRDKQYKERKW